MNKSFVTKCVCCLSVIICGEVFAQGGEAKTLFGHGSDIKSHRIGFFAEPMLGLTQMDGSSATLLNLRGGLNMNDKFSIGAFYSTSLNEIRPQSETIPDLYMDYRAYGGFVEYTLLSKRLFHITLPLYMGYGEVEMDREQGDGELGEANFYTIEPSALLEINILKFMRFNLGAGYRFVGPMNYRNLDQSDLSGFTAYMGLKLGLFR